MIVTFHGDARRFVALVCMQASESRDLLYLVFGTVNPADGEYQDVEDVTLI